RGATGRPSRWPATSPSATSFAGGSPRPSGTRPEPSEAAGAQPETAVRGGGGAVSASIRRRRAGCLDRPPRAAPRRRSDGAPASPLRYSASRACRTSFAGTPRASRRWASSLHVPRRDEVRDEVGRRLRRLEPAPAARGGRRGGLEPVNFSPVALQGGYGG